MVMSLPMVTCPLCCRPGFSSSESLCSALVDATTRNLSCPICNCQVSGLDKLTVHLFSHSLNRFGPAKIKDSIVEAIETSETCFTSNKCNTTTAGCDDFYNNKNYRHIFTEESHASINNKEDYRSNNSNVPVNSCVSNDTALIYLRSDNGQLFAISSENCNPNLKNLTINTQNYITSTNITTSTVQTNVIGNMHKRKYCDVFDKDSSFSNTYTKDMEHSPETFMTGESVLSFPSTPSVSSDTDRCNNEKVFESCKDLLTKGDFSTNCNDLSDQETNDSNMDGDKCEQEKSDVKKGPSSTCDVCSYVFPNKTILAMHNQLIHKKNETEVENKRKLLVCNLCPRTFSLRSSLMIHRRVAHAGGFGSSDNTLANKAPALNVSCQVCGKYFTKDIYLSQHMKVHDEKQWQCTICAKGFTTKYFLKKHRRLHTGEMPYRCKTCSKSFTFQQTYRKHLLYHNNDKPYCCAQCGRLFKELSTLHNHERIHSGEKPFTCETCGKAFRQRVSYLVHRRIHTGVMPYKCTACNKSFRYKISQRTHKCTAQPPGVVVRTQGYLVHRLQAAMNKAGEAATTETNAVAPDTQHKTPTNEEPKVALTCAQNENDETSVKPSSSSTIELNKTDKKSDVPKSKVDKPQIYLLVKGSNGETYYQPLIISQNVVQPPPGQLNMTIACDSSKSPVITAKGTEVSSTAAEMSKEEAVTESSNEFASFTNKILSSQNSLLDSRSNEVKNSLLAGEKESMENESSSMEKLQNREEISKPALDRSFVHNDTSSGILSDLFESLISVDHQNEETTHEHKAASENCLNSNHSTESSDLFSMMFSPSSSSVHDKYGCLSSTYSPNTSADQTDRLEAPSLSAFNDAHQSSFFESFSDDTLKELLFGEVK